MERPDSSARAVVSAKAESVLLACLLESIPDRIYFKDKDGRFLRVSRAEAEYLGVTYAEEVTGKTDFDFFERELAQASFEDEQTVMRTGEPITGKVERKALLDGRTGWALVAKIPLRDAAGQLIGTCGISKDITHLKDIEEALQVANGNLASQKTRLEEALSELNTAHDELKAAQQRLIDLEKVQWIARLAFGMAHEIRNPLGTLEMGVSYLASRPFIAQDSMAAPILAQMSEAIARADVVISALMDGAASSGVKVKAADIAATVELAVDMMKSSPREGAVVETEF